MGDSRIYSIKPAIASRQSQGYLPKGAHDEKYVSRARRNQSSGQAHDKVQNKIKTWSPRKFRLWLFAVEHCILYSQASSRDVSFDFESGLYVHYGYNWSCGWRHCGPGHKFEMARSFHSHATVSDSLLQQRELECTSPLTKLPALIETLCVNECMLTQTCRRMLRTRARFSFPMP